MLGVLFLSAEASTIYIYNVLSGTHTYSHQVRRVLGEIWTHGEYIRYATFASKSITIWEFGFTSRNEPTQVESLSTPDGFNPSRRLTIHPTLSRLAFTDRRAVLVWDCRECRFLLESEDLKGLMGMSFSLDGRLFACGMIGPEIYLWKESPSGYVLHKTFQSGYESPKNHISPDGGLITGWSDSGVQVWRTTDPATSLSNISTQTSPRTGICIVGFSPGEVLAAITQLQDNVVTVLNLESGDTWLVIDTDVKIDGLGVGRGVIVVVGEGKIVTWDLPASNCALDARANIDDSAQITKFIQPQLDYGWSCPISISVDLRRMVIAGKLRASNLHLYDMSTGQCLASVSSSQRSAPWFPLGRHEVWCYIDDNEAEGWSIVEDNKFDATRLECIGATKDPPGGFPWEPSNGYEVTDDGWVLSSDGRRLLWLPPYSRSDRWQRAWGGRFLALLRPAQPEPFLLELPAE